MFKSLVQSLNRIFNKNHNWFDYDNWGKNSFSGKIAAAADSIIAKYTGNELTGAEREAQDFSAEEAQKSRDFTEFMARNKYQMETQSMEASGLNPAMMYGGGQLVPTAANGAQGSPSAPSGGELFDVISNLMRLPAEIAQIKADAERAEKEGAAAEKNAETNRMNAEVAARNAAVNERIASVQEFRAQFESMLADSNIKINSAQLEFISKQAQKLQKEYDLMDDYLAVAQQNADSQSKAALAALQNARAAIENAETNRYLSASQSAMFRASAMLDFARSEGQNVINQYVGEKEQAEITKLINEGVTVSKQGELIDKEGKKCTAETIATYVECGATISHAAVEWVQSIPNVGRMFVKGLGK